MQSFSPQNVQSQKGYTINALYGVTQHKAFFSKTAHREQTVLFLKKKGCVLIFPL